VGRFQQEFRHHKRGDAKTPESTLYMASPIVALTEVQDILNWIIHGFEPSENLVPGRACLRDG
jgi:hypothetical protein